MRRDYSERTNPFRFFPNIAAIWISSVCHRSHRLWNCTIIIEPFVIFWLPFLFLSFLSLTRRVRNFLLDTFIRSFQMDLDGNFEGRKCSKPECSILKKNSTRNPLAEYYSLALTLVVSQNVICHLHLPLRQWFGHKWWLRVGWIQMICRIWTTQVSGSYSLHHSESSSWLQLEYVCWSPFSFPLSSPRESLIIIQVRQRVSNWYCGPYFSGLESKLDWGASGLAPSRRRRYNDIS